LERADVARAAACDVGTWVRDWRVEFGEVAPAAAYDVGLIYQGFGSEGPTTWARCMLDRADTAPQTDILG
jgi:hypothetical protein